MLKVIVMILVFFNAFLLHAEDLTSKIDSGDTAWMLISTALVIFMTPAGLALFYGGLSSKKNSLNTIGMSYMAFCVATIAWFSFGYSLTFSGDTYGFIGDFNNIFLRNISVSNVSGSIPTLLFACFQGTFAAIAVAIVSGSVIERVKFSSWLIFSFLWLIFAYVPVAHWVWGGGFLSQSGELDFAGGTVIHINAGISGLIFSLLLGKRKDHHHDSKPISIKLAVLGSAILWFGWFGFNAGSSLGANAIAANALLVTNIAACAGGLSWLLIEWYDDKKPGLLGMASGVVSGLVGITPAAGYVNPLDAMLIGLLSGLTGYLGAVKMKKLLNYDDTLDAFGIHGLVGILGSLAVGIWANPSINSGIGAVYGNISQIWVQAKVILLVSIYSIFITVIIYYITFLITKGIRISSVEEEEGMDTLFHDEKGFNLHD